jgi:transcriptional regulator with XRE-family HTH domain
VGLQKSASNGSRQVYDEASLGKRLRNMRHERGMSLHDLAAASGLSVGMISQIERGGNSPSYRSLRMLSSALGVPIEQLFTQAEPLDDASLGIVVHPRNRRVLQFEKRGITTEYIDPDTSGIMQMMLVTISPGGSSGKDNDRHVGEEGGLVLAGAFELFLGSRQLLLNEGDSFRFSAEEPHRFRNPGVIPTRLVWFITPTLYGRAAMSRTLVTDASPAPDRETIPRRRGRRRAAA